MLRKKEQKTEDRKLIAGVFYNRLNLGMPLQSNIAILYAEGKLGQNISLADDAAIDTSIDSPYNDYTKVGLMPGPVDSPSLDAIESSINQTKSDYLYFVANVQDGKVYYATTLEEHDRNVQEHINSKLNQSNSTKLKLCGFPHNFALKHIFINSIKRKLRKMVEKTYPMTLKEKEKLEKELEELKLVRRPEVVERIKIARSYGDLSENSEYEAAKDEQAFVEGQISSLETKIRYAENR